jgi:predicted secreted protein
MGKYTGRDVLIEFAIGNEDDDPAGLTWLELGMMRGKGMKVAWDTADATADMSPEFTKEKLVTFKDVEFSGDGVARTEAIYNQATLKAHIYNPGSGTSNQPKAWIRQTAPDGVTEGPFIFSEWSSDAPYSDVVTWSTTASSNGAVTFTPA